MDCAPLNLAHFHERRADKLIKRHKYDEACKAIETSMLYLQDAYKNAQIAKALDVLNTQKWEYQRKLQQIQLRKQQHERLKLKEIVPPATLQNDVVNVKTVEIANAQSIARSIDKTIKEFNDKYGSTSLVSSMQQLQLQQTQDIQDPKAKLESLTASGEGTTNEDNTQRGHSSLLPECYKLDELPSLAPLELPSFDYTNFMSSSLVENFHK